MQKETDGMVMTLNNIRKSFKSINYLKRRELRLDKRNLELKIIKTMTMNLKIMEKENNKHKSPLEIQELRL